LASLLIDVAFEKTRSTRVQEFWAKEDVIIYKKTVLEKIMLFFTSISYTHMLHGII